MTEYILEKRRAVLQAGLMSLARSIADEETAQRPRIDAVLARHKRSAVNLAHYLGLRREDIHHLQLELAAVGLSSLGRSEGHVRDSLQRACAWLVGERGDKAASGTENAIDQLGAAAILHENTHDLLGPRPKNRHVYIMVTAPNASVTASSWADEALDAGADLLRINGAYGSPAEWAVIASGFKSRAAARGKSGRVIVDLPGPKLRVYVRRLEQAVVHLRRDKDRFGRTVAPTHVLLVAEHRSGAEIPIPPEWLRVLEPGDVFELTDSGNRRRKLIVGERTSAGVAATCDRSLYLTSSLDVAWRRQGRVVERVRTGTFPRIPAELRFSIGDVFRIGCEESAAGAERPELVFSEPQLLAQVRTGERVVLDGGKVVAVVEAVRPNELVCRVKHTLRSAARIRSGKGVAFPDSDLAAGKLGPQDDAALDFALEHADGVGVSFVNSAAEVALVGERIARAGRAGFGMILKLETRSAMRNLPEILFEALKYHPVGLMIARGDLAVELSFERLAEMQEELLWFGEACHLPVVWATEVLDTVARTGVPTRAEVTDAAMSMRAECVMLNKGPYIADATRMLDDIIRRMETHQYKKRSLYRRLSIAGESARRPEPPRPTQ